MSLHMTVSNIESIPGSYCTIFIQAELEDDLLMGILSLIATLRGVSKTSTNTGKDGIVEIHEDVTTFLEIKKREKMHYSNWFHFQFPDDPVLLEYHPDHLNWMRDHNTPKPQTLPPSGEFGPGIEIVYSVDVSVFDETSDSEITARTELTFTPTHEPEASDPRNLTITKDIPSPISLQSPMEERALSVALTAPQTIILSQPFALGLCVAQGARTPIPLLSTTLLKSVLVQLLVHTSIQSKDNAKERKLQTHTVAEYSSVNSHNNIISIAPQELDLAALCHSPKIPLSFPPSFTTSNIQRMYGLAVTLLVELEGKPHNLIFEIDSVTVLGAEVGSDARAREQKESHDPNVDGIVVYDSNSVPHISYPGLDEQLHDLELCELGLEA